jgi:hypothetical protein
MKKLIFTIATVACTFSVIAQDKFVTSALVALNSNDLEGAKKEIDRAMSSPETKEKPKALYAKAQIYFQMQRDDKYKATNPYRESSAALMRLAEIKPEYEKDMVNTMMYYCAAWYYNDGVTAYNNKSYSDAVDFLGNTMKIYNANAKRFEKTQFGKNLDTLAANCDLTLSRAAYFGNNYEEALKTLTRVVKNPVTRSADNYIVMLEVLDKINTAGGNKMVNEELAAVQEARAAYPDNINIRNMEINAYSKHGKVNDLVKRLEEEVGKDPNNADLNFNLGLMYATLANPKQGAKPANAAELSAKAEASLLKAVKAGPENGTYNYNVGSLYFSLAYDVNEKMNDITGNSQAEIAQFEKLKKSRDGYFDKALPYLEKAMSGYGQRESSLNEFDRETYRLTLEALKQIYSVQNKTDKVEDVKKKRDNLIK